MGSRVPRRLVLRLASVAASALALALALAGAPTAGAGPVLCGDTDLDGVSDCFDNCTVVVNPSQLDADTDGCGNACDCDFNQTGLCTTFDFNIFKACLGRNAPAAVPPPCPAGPEFPGGCNFDPTCEESDLDGSTVVTITDFNFWRVRFGKTPGPSNSPLKDVSACP